MVRFLHWRGSWVSSISLLTEAVDTESTDGLEAHSKEMERHWLRTHSLQIARCRGIDDTDNVMAVYDAINVSDVAGNVDMDA